MALLDRLKTVLFATAGLGLCGAAYAKEGQPAPWQLGFQPAATPIMEQIHGFHTYVTIIITLIALFVLFLLVYVMARFNERRNPNPSRTTHNTPLEIAWTVIPVLILVAIRPKHPVTATDRAVAGSRGAGDAVGAPTDGAAMAGTFDHFGGPFPPLVATGQARQRSILATF